MNWQPPFKHRFPTRFRPRLERLERRDLLSCTVFQTGDTMTILGDREANHIAIADTREGGIRVTCDRSEPQTFTGVKQIDLNTFGGHDEVTASFANPPDLFQFRVDLGAGNDRLAIRGFDPQPEPPLRRVSFVIQAGAGNDEVMFDMGDAAVNGRFLISADGGSGNDRLKVISDGSVLPESELRIALRGDAGDDVIEADFRGLENQGRFVLHADGGAGNDVLRGLIDLGPRSRGRSDILFAGDLGDDDLTLALFGDDVESLATAVVDGGRGNDVANVTRNVRVANCERIEFLDGR